MKKYKWISAKFWTLKQVIILCLVLVALSVISIFRFDHELAVYFKAAFDHQFLLLARFFTWVGLGDHYFLVSVLGFFLFRWLERRGSYSSSENLKNNFKFMFFCFLYSGITVLLLKALFGRRRPYHSPSFDAFDFQYFNLDWHFQSYPSGHSQVGFTLATFLTILFPKQAVWFWILAILIAGSRVVLHYHYLGDTLAGAAVGIFITYLTAIKFKKLSL